MKHDHVDMQHYYVNMHDEFVNIRLELTCCMLTYLGCMLILFWQYILHIGEEICNHNIQNVTAVCF